MVGREDSGDPSKATGTQTPSSSLLFHPKRELPAVTFQEDHCCSGHQLGCARKGGWEESVPLSDRSTADTGLRASM